MAHLTFRNVNDAFRGLVQHFHLAQQHMPVSWKEGNVRRTTSRNGAVLMVEEPVTITYTHPTERVLFNAVRDANPFFHLYEALWMLTGRNDVAPLAYYNSKISQFSDDGKTFNGAYGYRWRKQHTNQTWTSKDADGYRRESHTLDQLDILVSHLKNDPGSRRAVLQMWEVERDLMGIGKFDCPVCPGLFPNGIPCFMCGGTKSAYPLKDVCCNLSVMFSLRETSEREADFNKVSHGPADKNRKLQFLDMTVTNRSNDLVWGMLGANYVHFTILQEYMAARLGAEVGRYHHMTNNLHVYCEREDWKPEAWLRKSIEGEVCYPPDFAKPYTFIPLVRDPEAFERELMSLVGNAYGLGVLGTVNRKWDEPFFMDVASPVFCAFAAYKERRYELALYWCRHIKADDWRIACTQWIERRKK